MVTISLETGLQNGGLALLLLKASLPAPDGDVATLAVFAQVFAQGLLLWPCLAAVIYLRCRRRRSEQEGKEREEGKGGEVMEVQDREWGVGEVEGGEGRPGAEDRGHEVPGVTEEEEGKEGEGRQLMSRGGEESLAVVVDDENQESEQKTTKATQNGLEMGRKTEPI